MTISCGHCLKILFEFSMMQCSGVHNIQAERDGEDYPGGHSCIP
jgi:hypothetical protein